MTTLPVLAIRRHVLVLACAVGTVCAGVGCGSAEPAPVGPGTPDAGQADAPPPEVDAGDGPVGEQPDGCPPSGLAAATLLPEQLVPYEHLGFAVAASGDTVAVGAKDSDRSGSFQSGAVVVFERDAAGAWSQRNVLAPRETRSGDNFGFSVALSGPTLVVGAPFGTADGVETGVVYLFARAADGSWEPSARLDSPTGAALDLFGYAVAFDGERIAVGAMLAGEERQGVAYIYERDGAQWRLDATLQASDATPNANFGGAIAISGNQLLVGAPAESRVVRAAGAAYVFEKEPRGWVESAKLRAEDGARSDFLGFSVALARDTAVLGSYLKRDLNGSPVGAVYIFRNTGTEWVRRQVLVPPESSAGDSFGISVSLLGDVLAVGASGDDVAAPDAGAVHVFREEDAEWKPSTKLYRATARGAGEYGRAVALSDKGFVAAGAWMSGIDPTEVGAVEIAALPCPQR